MEPEMPLMRVDVGVSGGELVPSNQVSLLNMCRLALESKTQRDKVELSVTFFIFQKLSNFQKFAKNNLITYGISVSFINDIVTYALYLTWYDISSHRFLNIMWFYALCHGITCYDV